MSAVLQVSDIGENVREPVVLSRQRRRLSTILKQQDRKKGRPYIVSVHRAIDVKRFDLESLKLNDNNVYERKQWNKILVGPEDVVVITYLPLGGMGGGGGKGGGKQIGMMLAMLVFAVVAPMIVGAIGGPLAAAGGGLSMLGKLVTTGLVAGMQYFMSKANKPEANKNDDQRPVYGISGGGNVPRPGDRIPVHYGRTWINPDLSQPDFFFYEGTGEGDSVQVLLKRMTVGMGDYDILTIRVGQAVVWKDGDSKAPFEDAEVEHIVPNGRSTLVPSSVYSSDQVGGSELPRPDDGSGVTWAGPFVVVPSGETTKKIQLDYSLPNGLYAVSSKNGKKLQHVAPIEFQYSPLDNDNQPTNNWTTLYNVTHSMNTTRAQRFTKYVAVPEGRYAVRARQANPRYEGDQYTPYDQVMWDGLRAFLDKEPRRPGITELAMKVRSGKSTGNVPFSDVWVEVQRKLPTWNGVAWTAPIATRKAIWAAIDILRNQQYGAGAVDGEIDLPRFLHYAATLVDNDTCSGTVRGPVSVGEALSTVLGPIRAEPVFLGGVWSITRDEARGMRKHLITRRQIVKDSSGVDYDLDMGDGASDVIVEYFVDGDPKKRNDYRHTIGPESNTPRRIQLFGVTDFDHASMLAKWYAAVAYWRRENRLFTTELAGRNFGRNEPALIDTWFLDDSVTAGVDIRSGFNITLDADLTFPAGAHAVFRNEQGLEWGPVAITPTGPRDFTVSTSDATVIGSFTGQTFSSLFSRTARMLPISVLIGTIATTTSPYIIRTARYQENGNVEISAVYDAPEVWNILGEAPPAQPPIAALPQYDEDILPIVPWVRANVVQKATSLVLEWAVGETRGARGYIIDIRYGLTSEKPWETAHNGPGAEGAYTIDYDEDDIEVRVRARAYNARGVLSAPVFTSAKLFKPTLSGEVADMLIELEMLQGQLRRDILEINRIGADSLRDGIRRLEERINELANSAATEAGNSYEANEFVKVAVDKNYAAIKRETTLRTTADESLAQTIETQGVRFGELESAITTESTTRAQKDEAIAQQMTTLQATLGGDVTAAINEERTARVSADSALSQRIDVTTSTLNGHTATISSVQQSVNGVSAQFGVAIEIDGRAVGGYRLTGFRRLDGGFYSQFGISGDLVVDGTIWGTKLAASSIITQYAQINNAIILNAHIADAQITYAKIGYAEIDHLKLRNGSITTTWAVSGVPTPSGLNDTVYVRAGGRTVVIFSFPGFSVSGNDNPPQYDRVFTLYVDGASRGSITARQSYAPGQPYSLTVLPFTWQWIVNGLGEGNHSFSVRNGSSLGSCIMTTFEFAR